MSKSLLDQMPGEVRSVLNSMYHSPGWKMHEQLAQELIDSAMREIATLTDPVMIYRTQGKIEGIRLLLGQKESLNPKQPVPLGRY